MYVLPSLNNMCKLNLDNIKPQGKDFTPLTDIPIVYNPSPDAFCVRHMFQNKFYNISKHLSGLGDFIRGSCALYNLCKKNGWILKICFYNYPEFDICLHNDGEPHPQINVNSVPFIPWNAGHQTIEEYINNDIQQGKTYSSLSTNLFPINNIVPPDFQPWMQKYLQLTDDLQNKYNEIVYNIPAKSYIILHLRTPNRYESKNTYTKLTNAVKKLNLPAEDTYLMCMDVEYQNKISVEFGYKTLPITTKAHLGIDSNVDDIQNTLIEFTFMSNAKIIHQVSPNAYGSGFSEWCAKTYNIPLIYHKC